MFCARVIFAKQHTGTLLGCFLCALFIGWFIGKLWNLKQTWNVAINLFAPNGDGKVVCVEQRCQETAFQSFSRTSFSLKYMHPIHPFMAAGSLDPIFNREISNRKSFKAFIPIGFPFRDKTRKLQQAALTKNKKQNRRWQSNRRSSNSEANNANVG